jgi:hypothetical protein
MSAQVIRTYWLPVALLALAFLVTACTGATAPVNKVSLSDIYTSVAMSIAAEPGPMEPTATYMDISTPVPTSTQILGFPTVPTATAYSSSSSYSYANGCDNSAYVSDVTIPDGTELTPRETFTKTWEFQNTGGCAWTECYSIAFISGNDMDGSNTEIDESIAVGDEAEISVSLTAPDTVGTYTGYWRMANESGSVFGERVYVQIIVSNDVATSTATATPTSIATSTSESSTFTPTAILASATPLPTNTVIPTAVPTFTPEASSTGTPTS